MKREFNSNHEKNYKKKDGMDHGLKRNGVRQAKNKKRCFEDVKKEEG